MLWRRAKTYRTSPVRVGLYDELNSTQTMVDGFDLAAMQAAHVLMIGAGGIGSPVATALVQKGVGELSIADDDLVELKNCTRQAYGKSDIGKFKAHRLARNLAANGLFPTKFHAYPFRFQELIERGQDFGDASVIICGVDNNPTRRAVTEYAIANNKPVIHAAVSRTGGEAYVMVQKPGEACWGCTFPQYLNHNSHPCGLPGINDVLLIVAGAIVYAVDSLIAKRVREWNLRETYMHGAIPDRSRLVERRADCPVCGPQS